MTAKYYVQKGKINSVLIALREMKQRIDADEPGCVGYQVLQSQEDEEVLLLIETYVDEAALQSHRETPHFKSIIDTRIVPMLKDRVREFYTLQIH